MLEVCELLLGSLEFRLFSSGGVLKFFRGLGLKGLNGHSKGLGFGVHGLRKPSCFPCRVTGGFRDEG